MLKVLGMDRGFLFWITFYIRNKKHKSILMHHIFIAITIPMQHATSDYHYLSTRAVIVLLERAEE